MDHFTQEEKHFITNYAFGRNQVTKKFATIDMAIWKHWHSLPTNLSQQSFARLVLDGQEVRVIRMSKGLDRSVKRKIHGGARIYQDVEGVGQISQGRNSWRSEEVGGGSEEQEEDREDICTLLFTYICSYILHIFFRI